MTKLPTSFRLSERTLARLAKLAKMDEVSQAAVLERLVREECDRYGIR
jgi:predicted transcriptional regulator